MPYYGKPENQTNKRAVRLTPSGKNSANTADEGKTSQLKSEKLAQSTQPKAFPTLAKPTHLQVNPIRKDLQEKAPNSDAIFAKETTLFEIAPKATFTPTFAAFNQVVSSIYQTYAAKNVLTAKTLSPGMLSYYCTCMTWFRIIDLKRQNSQLLTQTEKTIYELIKLLEFSLPKPFSIYLKSVGNVTSVTEQTLIPNFPEFPVHNNHSLWAPLVTVATHNSFELYPTVGVAAEVLIQELHPTNAAWAPSVVPNGASPTNNLQSFILPTETKAEIKQIITGAGVTQNSVGSTIPNADINIPLLAAVSSALNRLDVFALENTSFSKMEPNGAQSQLVQITKVDNNSTTSIPAGDVAIHDYTRDSAGTVGMAIVYQYNTFREGPINNGAYTSWSCLQNRDNQRIVGPRWYANRNLLYDFPDQYRVRIFTTGSRNATVFRVNVFEELAK